METESNIIHPRAKTTSTTVVCCTILELLAWRKKIPESILKLVMANTLNRCLSIEKIEVQLLGYLITSRKLFLVLQSKRDLLDEFFKAFDLELAHAINDFLYDEESKLQNLEEFNVDEYWHGDLFSMTPLYDHFIFQMITGRVPKLKFNDPYLNMLMDKMHNYDYCSAMDYTGAKSVVVVSLKPKSFWDKGLKKTTQSNDRWIEYLVEYTLTKIH